MHRSIVTVLALVCACSGKTTAGEDVATDTAQDTSELEEALDLPGEPDVMDALDEEVFDPGCPVDNPDWTVGMKLWREGASEGYTLLAPVVSTETWLVDMCGRVVHHWDGEYKPGNAVYLLEDGHLLRTGMLGPSANPWFTTGGAGGNVQKISWDGEVVWDFTYASPEHLPHHDIEMLPSGNVLMIAWEKVTAEDVIEAGRDPALLVDDELWPDTIIEVRPTGPTSGEIVWKWRAMDHLVQDRFPAVRNHGVVADHPELIDINHVLHPQPDWLHANAVAYNAELDQIVLSVHNFSELWVIDHSTTTEQAAGPAGDLLYRWGNPEAYGAGTTDDRQLFLQHDAHWIADGLPGAGHILVFNNGPGRAEPPFSSVDEIATPVDPSGLYPLTPGSPWDPPASVWTYQGGEEFYSKSISGAQRLPGGNTLVCEGSSGEIFEVTADGEILWSYVSPVALTGIVEQFEPVPSGPAGLQNPVFRAYRFPYDHPAFEGRDMTPGDYIEL
jgi:hypothetical protein